MPEPRLCLVVDGMDLFRAPWQVSGRGPDARERMDYGALLEWAGAEPFGERAAAGHYYQRDHEAAEAFHGALERQGWTLHLTPREQGWQAQKEALLAILQVLQRVDCDVLYCGGDSYNGRITAALHRLAEREGRGLAIACFDGFRTIDEGPWRVYDIVRDTGAMPETIYDRLPPSVRPPQRWTSASPANGVEPPLATALRRAGAAPRSAAAAKQVFLLIDWHDIEHRLAAICERAGAEIAEVQWPQAGRWLRERSPSAVMGAAAYIEDDQDDAVAASAAGIDPVVLRSFAQPGGAARVAIGKALEMLIERGWNGDLYFASHDAAHLPALERLAEVSGGGVHAVGFLEQFEPAFAQSQRVQMLDLERDAGAFAEPLPGRFPPIEPIDYDPLATFGKLLEEGRAVLTSGRYLTPENAAFMQRFAECFGESGGSEELGGALAAGAGVVVGLEHL